jgi:hypothetical protein
LSSTNQACFLQYKFWTFVIFLQVLDREDWFEGARTFQDEVEELLILYHQQWK